MWALRNNTSNLFLCCPSSPLTHILWVGKHRWKAELLEVNRKLPERGLCVTVWLRLCVTLAVCDCVTLTVCDSGCVWLQLCVTLAVWDWLAGSLNELSFASSSFCLTLPGSPRLFRIWTLGDQPGSELGAMWSKLRQWQNSGSVGLECLTQNSWHYEIILGVMINKGQWCLHTGAVRIYTLNMTVFLGGN